jgi:SagB-type dehydrogenase family enzyme
MRERTVRLRRAESLYVCWKRGRLIFHNFAKRQTVSGRAVTFKVLDFFNRWRTSEEAVARFVDYTPASVRTAVLQLTKYDLLLPENSAAAARDHQIAKQWASWLPEGSFHFSTKDAAYVRSNSSLARLKSSLPKTPQPKIFKSIRGAKKIFLPKNAVPDSEFARVLMGRKTHRVFSREKLTLSDASKLLSLVWGVKGYLRTRLFGKLAHKTSPSAGARHPGEVYLMALRVKGLKPGLYHYHPGHHYLETISTNVTPKQAWRYCAYEHHARNAAALFLMTAVFQRTMWKYHKPRAYRVVLLDAGHLCQTFCLVATWLGLAPFCTAALKDTLIENDLGIDGIQESILYAAGVGLPPKRKTNREIR